MSQKHKNTKPPPNPQQKQQQTIIKAAGHNEQVTLQSDPNLFFLKNLFTHLAFNYFPAYAQSVVASHLLLPLRLMSDGYTNQSYAPLWHGKWLVCFICCTLIVIRTHAQAEECLIRQLTLFLSLLNIYVYIYIQIQANDDVNHSHL